jgi:hypothetical protein
MYLPRSEQTGDEQGQMYNKLAVCWLQRFGVASCAKRGIGKSEESMVERAGFEPAYACAGRFTVCCL